MKHKGTRFLVFLLIAALLLSACSKKAPQESTSPAPPTSAPAVTEPAAPTEPETEPAPPETDVPETTPAEEEPEEPEPAPEFSVKFEGDKVAGTGEAVDGVYRVKATKTDGESWHIKLESNYPTVPGRDYRVTYRFRSDVAGKVKFGDQQEFPIVRGENAVTGIVTASNAVTYLDFQLGTLKPFTIDFTGVQVEELQDKAEYESALPADLKYDANGTVTEQHDEGYDPQLALAADGITLHMNSVPAGAEVWKTRVYVHTGATPEPGKRYRVSADVLSDKAMDFEVCFNNGEKEKGYAALYGLKLNAKKAKTVEQILVIPAEGFKTDEVVLQFALGKAPKDAEVKISNVRVETISDEYASVLPASFALNASAWNGTTSRVYTESNPVNVPLDHFSYSGTDAVYERHDEGYVVSLQESADSAVMKIEKAPDNAGDRGVWKAKLYAETGIVPKAGTTYRVQFDLASEKDQAEYEACFDGSSENAYGALYGRTLKVGQTDSISYTFTPDAESGPLTLRIQLGKTDSGAGNTVTFKNLKVETLSATYQEVGKVSYTTGRNVREEHGDDIEQSVDASGSSATLTVDKARSGGGVWSSRLFVETGVTPENGARYRVKVNVSSKKALNDFEIVYDNGSAEAGYAKQTGLSLGAGGSSDFAWDFTAPDSGSKELVLRFQLGNSPAANEIKVSSIRIMKLEASTADVPMSGFKYPVTTDPVSETVPAAYSPQTLSLSASHVAWDGFEETSEISGNNAILNVTVARPVDVGGVWSSRLHVGTGVVLEKGAQYKVSTKVHSQRAIGDFQLLYSNGSDENDDYNPGGKGYQDGSYGLSVGNDGTTAVEQTFTVPERSTYKELVLRFQLGNTPAPNVITVSDIKVEKWIPEQIIETGGSTDPGSFFVEFNNEAKAALSGDGKSATALVEKSGDDWHIKFYAQPQVTLEAGRTYEISMKTDGASGFGVFYKRVGGEEDSFGTEYVNTTGQTVTHIVTPGESGTLEIMCKLGHLPANTSVKVSDIAIRERTETEGENLMKASLSAWAPVNFWAHEEYAASASNTDSSASMNISSVSSQREAWKVKFFVETGVKLQKGTLYRISADVKSTENMDYEICYNNAEKEQALGGKFGLKAASANSTVTYEVTPEEEANLILQFNLGLAEKPCTVTVSNVKIEELKEGTGTSVLDNFRCDSVGSFSYAADDGYDVSLEKKDSSAVFKIAKAPASRNPWNAKLHILTGFTPANNKAYRVSFDVEAAKAQKTFGVFLDGNTEATYGQHSQALKAGKQTVSVLIPAGSSKGQLSIQVRPGKTDGTDGNTYTVSNVKIQSVTLTSKTKKNYSTASTLWTHSTYSASLSRQKNSASVKILKTPAKDMEAWKTKLFIYTGVTLKAGQKYRISLDVSAEKETGFEICYNHGSEEKGLGALYGLTASPEAKTIDYTVYAPRDINLVIQVSLGNCAAPNVFTVSHVRVDKAGTIETVSDQAYDFVQ